MNRPRLRLRDWRHHGVSGPQQAFDFAPVDAGAVQSQTDPALGPDVGRYEVAARILGDQGALFTRRRLTPDRDASVVMMIVSVIGEYLLPKPHREMLRPRPFDFNPWEGFTQPDELVPSSVGIRRVFG